MGGDGCPAGAPGRTLVGLLVGPVAAVLIATLLGACSTDQPEAAPGPTPSRSVRTLTPVPLPPEPPPSGELRAEMRQSSRDAAAGRMEVWIDNDTARPVRPVALTYADRRLRAPLTGYRLRAIPSQAERGFPLDLPRRPACERPRGHGVLTVRYAGRTVRLPVADPTDVTGRHTRSRCLEIAVGRVATLAWADEVPSAGGEGDPGTLTLLVEPTGRPGPTLRIDTISGTPVLAPAGASVWRPGLRVRGTDAPRRLDLPLKPNRCDAHAFAESGGATAFIVGVRLDGEPGQLTLRMSTAGARAAIDFARRSCGMLETITGG